MTRRELVRQALAHEETPRIPYCVSFTPEGERRLGEAIGRKSALEFADNDIIQVKPPWWGWEEPPGEWKAAPAPESPARVKGTGSYTEFFDFLKKLRDNTDKYILAMVYGSHFEKANSVRGIENFLADMAGEPEFARKLLSRIIDKNMVMLENFLSAPEIDGVLLGSDWGSQLDLLMSPAVWDDMIRPGEQKEYGLIHSCGKDVWVHSCGNITKLIPALIEMGVDVLNPVQPEAMELSFLKSEFGEKITFWGGVGTQKILPMGTPEEVKREVRRVRNMMSAGGGYILAPSQEIQGDIPAENIIALLEAAKEYDSKSRR